MANLDDWNDLLDDHPILSLPRGVRSEESLELSFDTLHDFLNADGRDEKRVPAGRRQLMCMKDADLILACGSEIRMASLNDAKVSGGSQKSYKILHTPSIEFDIHQIALSPNRKLLAISGATQVVVVVLPTGGFSKLVTARIDCKALHVGKNYHNNSSPPIAKIDWHPWGEAGSTLLVMSFDGKLREYDISFDPDEPRETLDFLPDRRRGAYGLEDDSEREIVSFTYGKGRADWGPLTLYGLARSGDIYAICPYVPQNALIPPAYVHALDCFVTAKQEFVAERGRELSGSFSTLYEHQRKFVNGVMKQLPPEAMTAPTSQAVLIHSPATIPYKPSLQGPFLLQPSPPELTDSPGGTATDITYVAVGCTLSDNDDDDTSATDEDLGVILVAFQDGKVDIYLDIEKAEAKWDFAKRSSGDLPALAVYESLDLGVIANLKDSPRSSTQNALDLVLGNHAQFYQDPIYDDTVYAYHAFGVHSISLWPLIQSLVTAAKLEEDESRVTAVQRAERATVQGILDTSSHQKTSTCPVVAAAVPGDVYLTYSIFLLTSTVRLVVFPLNLRTESLEVEVPEKEAQTEVKPSEGSDIPGYVAYSKALPFNAPAVLSRLVGAATISQLSVPKPNNYRSPLVITPETLRFLTAVFERFSTDAYEVKQAFRDLAIRLDIQRQEYNRQHAACRDILERINGLNGPRRAAIQDKLKRLQDEQRSLLDRMDRVLQVLINKASPELNEHETRWFAEICRMKGQILGVGRYDQSSLKARSQLLKAEFDRILPALREIVKQDSPQVEQSSGANVFSQSALYSKISTSERAKLNEAIKLVTKLAGKLEISTLGKPPVVSQEGTHKLTNRNTYRM